MIPIPLIALVGTGGALSVLHNRRQKAKNQQRVRSFLLPERVELAGKQQFLPNAPLAQPLAKLIKVGGGPLAWLPQSESGRLSKDEAEREINRLLSLSVGGLALSVVGAVAFSAANLVVFPLIVYVTIPIWRGALESLVQERKVNFYVLYGVAQLALIVTGQYFLAALDHALFFVAEKLVNRTQEHAKTSLISVFAEQPRSVWMLHNNTEIEVPVDRLKPGDWVVVAAGQIIGVDGTVTEGYATVDQHILTGESRPVEKNRGEEVFAGTVVLQGRIVVQAEKTGAETVAAQVGQLLERTTDYRVGVQLKGEAMADQTALPLLALGALALPVVGRVGSTAVLFSGIGDTIRVTAPTSVLNFLRLISQEGILVKDGRALELLVDVDTFVFDKTGTLTQDEPHVGAIHTVGAMAEDDLLRLAGAAEEKQSHPIARAILAEVKRRGLTLPRVTWAEYEVGYGLQVAVAGQQVRVGSRRFMTDSGIVISTPIQAHQTLCDQRGYSLVYVAVDGRLAGAIELQPTIRAEAGEIIAELRARNLNVVIISGDHPEPTRHLAAQLGIGRYFAHTRPEDKAALIAELQAEGRKVCFVGDGINDSIALKQANVSISLNGAASMAVDTAAIILMDGSLRKLPTLLRFVDDLDVNMRRNMYASLAPGALIIGGAFFLHLGVLGAITIYNIGLLIGMANAMTPALSGAKSERVDS